MAKNVSRGDVTIECKRWGIEEEHKCERQGIAWISVNQQDLERWGTVEEDQECGS